MKIKYDIKPCPFRKGMWVSDKKGFWEDNDRISAYQIHTVYHDTQRLSLIVDKEEWKKDKIYTFDYFIEVPSDKSEIYKYED